MNIKFDYAAFSDVGLIRKNNQDGGYASQHLLVLADGMGGAAAGDVASSVAVAHLAAIDDNLAADDLLPALRGALRDAQRELMERADENPKIHGMGTTCIAIMRANNKLAMVHIGDSRAYLLRGSTLTQVTHDHTLVQYLVDRGELTPEEAEHHPKRNVIMRALGDTGEDIRLDESVREALPQDRWLLCSDGLFGVVSKETITATLLAYPNLHECGEALISLALAGGAPDNVTVVLADVLDMDSTPSSRRVPDKPVVVGSAAVDYSRPSRGSNTPAGQAAALVKNASSGADEDAPEAPEPTRARSRDYDDQPSRGVRILRRIIATLGVLGLIALGLWGGYAWTQTQYYVANDDGWVTIYRGIPQTIGPISLSSVEQVTNIRISDLTGVAQMRLESPITRPSLAGAEDVVKDLRAQMVGGR